MPDPVDTYCSKCDRTYEGISGCPVCDIAELERDRGYLRDCLSTVNGIKRRLGTENRRLKRALTEAGDAYNILMNVTDSQLAAMRDALEWIENMALYPEKYSQPLKLIYDHAHAVLYPKGDQPDPNYFVDKSLCGVCWKLHAHGACTLKGDE